jgi:hypothetical protein
MRPAQPPLEDEAPPLLVPPSIRHVMGRMPDPEAVPTVEARRVEIEE